ncbi:22085_t:CDS:2 [Cetraspora pellucida]|uniref:22085_t:CDS:1 n=1 Tax=Cetraspora pellucida TaxID=1433469 RepID=A0A9N9FF34_9GLOM|nr:22085_t:CDS:2 [Cetraspora pellucida]
MAGYKIILLINNAKYYSFKPEKDKSDKNNDSTEMHKVIHNKVLNTIDFLEQYF